MASPIEDKLDQLIDAVNDLADTLKTDNSSSGSPSTNFDKVIDGMGKLSNQLQSMGRKFNSFMEPLASFEKSMLRINMDVPQSLDNVVKSTLPLSTRLQATQALTIAGLEKNTQTLGETVARSETLGENITQLSAGFRQIQLSLGLNASQIGRLGVDLEETSMRYKTSTTELVTALSQLGNSLAVLGQSGAFRSAGAVSEAVAMTQRIAPGLMQDFINGLIGGGTDQLGMNLMRGLEPLAARLLNDQVRDPQELFNAITTMVTNIEDYFGPVTGENFRVISDILQQQFGLSFEQLNSLKAMAEQARNVTPEQKALQDRMDAVNRSLTNLLPRIQEPLIKIAERILRFIDNHSDYYNMFVNVLAASTFATMIRVGLQGIASALTVAGLGKGLNAIPVIGGALAFGASLFAGSMVDSLLEPSKKTAEQTGKTAEEIAALNKRDEERFNLEKGSRPDTARQLNEITTASIGRILALSQDASMLDNPLEQRKLTIRLVEEMEKTNLYLKDFEVDRRATPRPVPQGTPVIGGGN